MFVSFCSKAKELQIVAKASNIAKNCWKKLLVDEAAERLRRKGTKEKIGSVA